MQDHDQRFKTLLHEFFAEFFQLFFPDWADRFDFTQVEWLDKEMFPDPPQGDRRVLDLVVKVPVKQAVAAEQAEAGPWIALLHVEVESADRVAPFRPRMFQYYQFLRHRHNLPVLPVGLFLRVGMEGIGWDVYEERFWERTLVHFEYAYVGLPALPAVQYVQGENYLGVAMSALMQLSEAQRREIKAEAMRRFRESNLSEYRRFLLADFVEAYLPLSEADQAEYERMLETERYKGVKEMTSTWFDQGLERGLEQGLEQGLERGQRRLLRRLLENRFGPLGPHADDRLKSWPVDRLEELGLALLQAQSLRELGLED